MLSGITFFILVHRARDKAMAILATTATSTRKAARQGFVLAQLAVALMILTLLAVFAGSYLVQRINDSAAENTAKYLLSVRSGLVDFQLKHEAFLTGIDVSAAPAGTYPTPPLFIDWNPSETGVGEVAIGSVSDLIDESVLASGFSQFPPLGQKALWLLHRTGTCPSDTCSINAYVYTCHPISKERSTKLNATSCDVIVGPRSEADISLVGQVMISSEGYGGNDIAEGSDNYEGTLLGASAPRELFPELTDDRGRVVVAASLNATPFNQFVRQGDTREITLRNTLTVHGVITSHEGIVIDPETPVSEGGNCSDKPEGLYAMTAERTLAVCLDDEWFGLTNFLVRNTMDNVQHGATVTPINCPAPMVAWRQAALQASDILINGPDLNIQGTVSGSVGGSGIVSDGTYNLSGTFNGTFNNTGASFINSRQGVSISPTGQVVITPNRPNARAMVIQGCRIP